MRSQVRRYTIAVGVFVCWASVAPAQTPAEVIARLNAELVRIVRDPGLLERLSADGVTGTGSTPLELADYIRSESAKWSKVVRDAGIKLN